MKQVVYVMRYISVGKIAGADVTVQGLYASKPSWSVRLQEGEKIAALPVRQSDGKIPL